jgi:NAD(P)H-dependent FMN reductase
MINLKIILGSTREGRFGDKPAEWIYKIAQTQKDTEVELLDLREYPLPFFNDAVSPAMRKEPYTSDAIIKWAEKIKEADAYVMVAPEYNHGYSAVLKNALDSIYAEWNNKPVGFVSYGGVGGSRSVEQLREVAIELQMAPIRNAVHMPLSVVFDEKWQLKSNAFEQFNGHGEGLLTQLNWWARALKNARN